MVAAELERDAIREQWQSDSTPEWRLKALDEIEHAVRRELELLEARLAGLQEMRQTLLERTEKYQRLRRELRAQLRAQRVTRPAEPQEAGAEA
jgi:predicted component of type VI protein secretion system